jgi:hypothetical protein
VTVAIRVCAAAPGRWAAILLQRHVRIGNRRVDRVLHMGGDLLARDLAQKEPADELAGSGLGELRDEILHRQIFGGDFDRAFARGAKAGRARRCAPTAIFRIGLRRLAGTGIGEHRRRVAGCDRGDRRREHLGEAGDAGIEAAAEVGLKGGLVLAHLGLGALIFENRVLSAEVADLRHARRRLRGEPVPDEVGHHRPKPGAHLDSGLNEVARDAAREVPGGRRARRRRGEGAVRLGPLLPALDLEHLLCRPLLVPLVERGRHAGEVMDVVFRDCGVTRIGGPFPDGGIERHHLRRLPFPVGGLECGEVALDRVGRDVEDPAKLVRAARLFGVAVAHDAHGGLRPLPRLQFVDERVAALLSRRGSEVAFEVAHCQKPRWPLWSIYSFMSSRSVGSRPLATRKALMMRVWTGSGTWTLVGADGFAS